MSVLAIIPARGGSKGIPRKNLRLFRGKPLVAHGIEHALEAKAVTRVAVSTDDQEIAAVSREYGAEVVARPSDLSGDTASSELALLHALDHFREVDQFEPDLVVFLQATSPLRPPGTVQAAIEHLQREQADSLFSACSAHGFVWQLHAGRLRSLTYDHQRRPRRQEIGEHLVENGSLYVFKPWVLRRFENRLGGNIAFYRMDPLDSFQVDDPDDFERLERVAAANRREAANPDVSQIEVLVFDFDGVMTDNRVLLAQDGTESVWCHRGDGWGIARLKEQGMRMAVISTEKNPVVDARCRKLGLEVIQGCDDKLAALRTLAAALDIKRQHVAYVGNDVNDLGCLRWAGLPIAVADAVPEVVACARLTTKKPGGAGAVREVAEWFIAARTQAATKTEED